MLACLSLLRPFHSETLLVFGTPSLSVLSLYHPRGRDLMVLPDKGL